MSGELIAKVEVYNKTIEWIRKYVPNYKFSQLTYDILDYGFNYEGAPESYTVDEANEIVFSIIDKMKAKNVNGRLTNVEKAIWLCRNNKMHPYKHSASMGAGEFWTALIMNWNFSKAKGVDLEDESGKGVDIKAVTSSVGKIPCTFFDVNGNPITKEHGKIMYMGRLMWRKGWSFKGMYDAIRTISYCKIDYPALNRYIFYKFDYNTNMLTSVTKERSKVENEINNQLIHLNDKKIDLTHSLWEDGAYIFTFEEFGAI